VRKQLVAASSCVERPDGGRLGRIWWPPSRMVAAVVVAVAEVMAAEVAAPSGEAEAGEEEQADRC
jgi:hypothetical protein